MTRPAVLSPPLPGPEGSQSSIWSWQEEEREREKKKSRASLFITVTRPDGVVMQWAAAEPLIRPWCVRKKDINTNVLMEKKAATQIENKLNLGLLLIKQETTRIKALMGMTKKRVIPPNSKLKRCAATRHLVDDPEDWRTDRKWAEGRQEAGHRASVCLSWTLQPVGAGGPEARAVPWRQNSSVRTPGFKVWSPNERV